MFDDRDGYWAVFIVGLILIVYGLLAWTGYLLDRGFEPWPPNRRDRPLVGVVFILVGVSLAIRGWGFDLERVRRRRRSARARRERLAKQRHPDRH